MHPRSWQSPDHPLRDVLNCGPVYDDWVVEALKYLPKDVQAEVQRTVSFYSTASRDGCRIGRAICERREIILLSERILPNVASEVDDPHVRYFIFIVLHEVVHAIKKHRPPSDLSSQDNDAQESEADALAFSWFNSYIEALKNPHLKPLTQEEIDEAKKKNLRLMERAKYGG